MNTYPIYFCLCSIHSERLTHINVESCFCKCFLFCFNLSSMYCIVLYNQSNRKKKRCVSMIENRISSYLYNEFFSENNEKKCTAFQSMAWSLIVHKNTIKNFSRIFLQVFHLVSFISFFIKARMLLQFLSQAFNILYMFSPFSFVFALITPT